MQDVSLVRIHKKRGLVERGSTFQAQNDLSLSIDQGFHDFVICQVRHMVHMDSEPEPGSFWLDFKECEFSF